MIKRLRHLPKLKLLNILLLLFMAQPLFAIAQTVTETQPLSFGRVVIKQDDGLYTVALKSNCSGYTASPQYMLFFVDPQCASFLVTGYPANTFLTVNITPTTLTPQGGGGPANFTIINPFITPNNPKTDATGSVVFQLGATLRTSNSGGTYNNDTYDGIYQVDVAAK